MRNPREEFEKREAELTALMQLLRAEIKKLNVFLEAAQDDCQFSRRIKIRTVFSCIEAYISHLKQSAEMFAIGNPGLFSEAETLALQDRQWKMSGKGEVSFDSAQTQFMPNLKFAFAMFGKSIGKNYAIDFGAREAQEFERAIKIRNRITHPKTVESWYVSDDDIRVVDRAWVWFTRHLAEISERNSQK